MTTARNLALNDLRRQANHKTDASAGIRPAPASTADPETDLIAAEQASAAEAALAGSRAASSRSAVAAHY